MVIATSLDPIPPGAITALENQCKVKKDQSTCYWIVLLEKHYQKQEYLK